MFPLFGHGFHSHDSDGARLQADHERTWRNDLFCDYGFTPYYLLQAAGTLFLGLSFMAVGATLSLAFLGPNDEPSANALAASLLGGNLIAVLISVSLYIRAKRFLDAFTTKPETSLNWGKLGVAVSVLGVLLTVVLEFS